MDGILNKGKAMLSGNKGTTGTTGTTDTTGTTGTTGTNTGGQDYGDKAINAVEKKFGFDKDGKYDKYEEMGSDALRGQFEKSTGKKIPEKFSN